MSFLIIDRKNHVLRSFFMLFYTVQRPDDRFLGDGMGIPNKNGANL